jgi:hypothetical protein
LKRFFANMMFLSISSNGAFPDQGQISEKGAAKFN